MKSHYKWIRITTLLILLFAIIYLCFSCKSKPQRGEIIEGHISLITIDGCDYLRYEEGNKNSFAHVFSLTHKGNCRNHMHFENAPWEDSTNVWRDNEDVQGK